MPQESNRQKQAEETKRRVYFCALELFNEKTYEDVTIREICEKAQVAVGTFYHYFDNKESLMDEFFRQLDSKLEVKWLAYTPASPSDGIIYLIRTQLSTTVENNYIASAQILRSQLSNGAKYITDKNRFIHRILLKLVTEECAGGRLTGDPDVITDYILHAARGMLFDWCLHKGDYDLLAAAQLAVEMVLKYYGD